MAAKTVDEYIAARSEAVRQTLLAARGLIQKTLPGVKEVMKWGVPAYQLPDGRTPLYLYGGRDHAHLGFVEGASIDDPEKLLKGSGKMGRHIKLLSPADVKTTAIRRLLRSAGSTRSL